ncbi:tRNA pseudouridine synthase Pus10 isoform X1 [Tribolium castaneum]|uniref:tRNA pseudouridine synthase Pus10 isoform X1 n=1 Tax=Tribolium castaneum TaxID=7070 RepID=UPI0030FE086A
MVEDAELEIYNEIINKGCCKRCVLRYLGQCRTLLTFEHPNTCLVNFGYMDPIEEFEEERKAKIRKSNPCSVCLGLLQDPAIEEMFACEGLNNISEYLSQTFVAYITFPTCILIRDHSMKLHLKRLFPNLFDCSKVIKVNNAWRYAVEERLSQTLKKSYSHLSKLTLHFYTKYQLEDDELEAVQRVLKNLPKNNLSKHCVYNMLETISDNEFGNLVNVPPKVPLYAVTLDTMKFFSEAIHLIGNYLKYSRDLFQVQNLFNTASLDFSIETIIVDAVRNVASDFKDAVFKASGFDDNNIRVLGSGRTFHLQLNDPKFESVSKKQCQVIEGIIQRSKLMAVRNLRECDKRDICILLDNEQRGARSYKALCMVYKCKNIDYCINAVNMYESLNVCQKIPLKVFHKRKFYKKRRKIFQIKARKLKGNLVELDLCTQCGFSVPEFVNGDLGRTKPSLCDIMNAKVDVLAVDIVDFQPALHCDGEEDVII